MIPHYLTLIFCFLAVVCGLFAMTSWKLDGKLYGTFGMVFFLALTFVGCFQW